MSVTSSSGSPPVFRSVLTVCALALGAVVGCDGDDAQGAPSPEDIVEQQQSALLGLGGLLENVIGLGAPDHIGFVVSDVAAATAQYTAATNVRFQSISTSSQFVNTGGSGQQISFTRAYTDAALAQPFLEFVHADIPVGPWGRDASRPYLSYEVDQIYNSSLQQKLWNAGLRPVATANDFVFWEASGGVLIRLVSPSAAPKRTANGLLNIGFGVLNSVVYAPCDRDTVKQQFTDALGLLWAPSAPVPFPWTSPADGTTSLLNFQVMVSLNGPLSSGTTVVPVFETVPVNPPPMFVCTPSFTQGHIPFAVVDVLNSSNRLTAAGMEFVGGVMGLIGYYRSPDGLIIEVIDASFSNGG